MSDDPTPTVVLVRHGVTALNENHEIRAWSAIPLDAAKARPAIERTARQLEALGVEFANPIWTSDLLRARQTADILGEELLLEVLPVYGLRTWNLGNFEGQPAVQVLPRLDELIKHSSTPVPGGERHIEFVKRWRGAFYGLMRRAAAHPEVAQIAVVHSSNIEAARDIAIGKSPDHIQFGDSVKPGEAVLWRVVGGKLTEVPLAPEVPISGE